MPSLSASPDLSLNLNESLELLLVKSTIAPVLSKAGSSLHYWHELTDVFEYLSLYVIKLYIDITTSISLVLYAVYYLFHLNNFWMVNGFLKITFILLLLAWASSNAGFQIDTVSVTSI